MKKLLTFILSVILVAASVPLSGYAEEAENSSETSGTSETSDERSDEYEKAFSLPENMRAVILNPDFTTDKPFPEDTFADIANLSMNTVIIATSGVFIESVDEADDETVVETTSLLYNTDMNNSNEQDFLTTAIESATENGLNTYLLLDIDAIIGDGDIEHLIAEIHKFTLKYKCDGIILDSYYTFQSTESFKQYMKFGAGIGYKNWMYAQAENFFKTASDTIRLTDNTIPVGIMARDVWANKSDIIPEGSATSADFQAYYDGFADTFAFVNGGYADFVLTNAPDALTESNVKVPFEGIVGFWGGVCKSAEIPMYIVHHNQRIGESSSGWSGDDQLLRQLTAAEKTPAYKGSVFNSLPDLKANRLNSTVTMQSFFDGQINKESLFEDLVMHSPQSKNYSTNDAVAIFQGTYDDNFDVFLNDEKITLNEAGNFYLEKPLNIGVNNFTLKHKGKTVTYSISRVVNTLYSIDSSISNDKILVVEGETVITINAIAYRGARVTAAINGQTVQLAQQDSPLDDPTLNVSYAPFSGKYKVPAGIAGQEQNLGVITVTSSVNIYSKSMYGATVKVIALPELPPPPPANIDLVEEQHSVGDGEVVGKIDPIRLSDEVVSYVRVVNNNTAVYASNTTGTEHNPDISRLPSGSKDYYRAKVGNYYTTENGKRVSTDDAVVESGYGMGENSLQVLASGTSGKSSYFKIALEHSATFNIKAAGTVYTTDWGGDYNISDFNATHIYVDFDNVTSVTKLPDFDSNTVFSSGKWEAVTIGGIPKFRLVLQLRRSGTYAGNYASYNSDGELTLSFPVLSGSLSGTTIVIDPGHGKTESGFDAGAVGHVNEFDVNFAVAQKLQSQLNALGATAILLPTDQTYFPTRTRSNNARGFNCDLFISLHCNAVAGNSGARGTEVWYYTPFSQPLASSISSNIASYFQNSVYSDGANKNRGAKYSYYFVTLPQDFPSVLVELGFVTNYEDAMALGNSSHQSGIANAVAEGIRKYLAR